MKCPYCGEELDEFDLEVLICPECHADLDDEDIKTEEEDFNDFNFYDENF